MVLLRFRDNCFANWYSTWTNTQHHVWNSYGLLKWQTLNNFSLIVTNAITYTNIWIFYVNTFLLGFCQSPTPIVFIDRFLPSSAPVVNFTWNVAELSLNLHLFSHPPNPTLQGRQFQRRIVSQEDSLIWRQLRRKMTSHQDLQEEKMAHQTWLAKLEMSLAQLSTSLFFIHITVRWRFVVSGTTAYKQQFRFSNASFSICGWVIVLLSMVNLLSHLLLVQIAATNSHRTPKHLRNPPWYLPQLTIATNDP